MVPSDYGQAQGLLQRIENHPTKYGAWESASQLAHLDIAPYYEQIRAGLKSSDPFSRECFLETLAGHQDPQILSELTTIFQYGPSDRTQLVTSLSRLRAKSKLPYEFYEDTEKQSRKSPRRNLHEPLDLVNAIPNIVFPKENNNYAHAFIQDLNQNPEFFTNLDEDDIGSVHAMFYVNYEDPKNREYRKVRMWDFDASGNPVEPYGQPFVGPASLPCVVESLVKKMRNPQQAVSEGEHPLQLIGETFFHQNIIHPFYDCNGRTNFLLMDLCLLASRLPYIKMVEDDLPEYYRTLNLPEPTQFVQFLCNLIKRD